MPKKGGRGRPKRSRDQNCQGSDRRNLSSPFNLSNMVENVHGCEESENADLQDYVVDNPSNKLEVAPGFVEEQERDMPKKRGHGRPKRSRDQTCQESVHRNTTSSISPSTMLQVVHECEESGSADFKLQMFVAEREVISNPNSKAFVNVMLAFYDIIVRPNKKEQQQQRESRVQNYHRNPENTDIYDDSSNMREDSPVDKEESDVDIRVRPKKNVRGRTRGLILEMKRKQSPDGKLDVVIHPTRMVAVGPGRNDFITDLSIILRKNARFNVNKWSRVPQGTRDTIVEKVLNNWRLPDTDMVRKAIIDEAGRLYRNWRNRLHEHYLVFETKEEALKHVPDDVDKSDWKFLADYFSSPSFEIMSMKNKASKAKQRTHHTSGRKSFQAASFDARDSVTGEEPDLQKLWQITHIRANGEWVDETSKEINDKVAEQIDERLLENAEDGVATIEPEIIKTAFKSVVGKKSYMQGFGEGLSESSSSARVQKLEAELDAQRMETENAKKECNEIRAKLVEVESQLAEERRKREESEARLQDRQKEMQEINSQVQTAIQSALSQYCPPKTEASTSSDHEKIAELEAQLHEAEDVITDIRSELARIMLSDVVVDWTPLCS
ncbi:hypothetical protein L195_g012255 [Trifolium pratense]|uniref:Uncharacterized protein n=1 Tax=Trifolium pratense TaxID=57577 RepID=A0A2K3PJU6_TRIPR|nr:hypothetical protein L195_g012255 [Trifolium pratense]